MKAYNTCANHPDRESLSFCHFCRDELCTACLNEGKEYYYCNKPECLKAVETGDFLRRDKCTYCGGKIQPDFNFCPSCGMDLKIGKGNDLITIAAYQNSTDAQLARTKLEAEEIEAFIADEHMVTINPGYNIAFGGVKLKVRRSDAEIAVKILGIKI